MVTRPVVLQVTYCCAQSLPPKVLKEYEEREKRIEKLQDEVKMHGDVVIYNIHHDKLIYYP